jgi:hypothetical protein
VEQGQVSFGIAGGGKPLAEKTLAKPDEIQNGNFQIKQFEIGLNFSARFSWTAYHAYQDGLGVVITHFADIAPLTGNLQDSDMGDMLNTPSTTTPDFGLAYGFYDSGSGASGLTNQDQAYVYLTRSRATWMGDLVEQVGSNLSDKPLNVWVLPGAHDSGMFDTTMLDTLLTSTEFIGYVASFYFLPIGTLLALGPMLLRRGIVNMAYTQKDNVETMLNLGVPYFDFRPGYLISETLSPGIYHQHLVVPGYSYADFLGDVIQWLTGNASEIVVVSVNFQGFASSSMQPTPNVLDGLLSQVLSEKAPTGAIVAGDKHDLASSYSELIDLKKRLIFLNQVGESTDASKYDSYNKSQYETTDVKNILNALNGMNKAGQAGHDYTVLQLQGTSTGLAAVIAAAFATLSDASSPLLSTKAMFDQATYPWVLEYGPRNLSPGQLLVLLNDFCDNALATYAMEMTKVRASQYPFKRKPWPKGITINAVDSTPAAPASVFQNKLYLFWKANDSSNRIFFSASADGQTWPTGVHINAVDATSDAPAASVFQSKLYLFWKANDSSNRIYFSASADGSTWPTGVHINAVDATSDAPAASVFQNKLYLFWSVNDSSNRIIVSASADGQTWPSGTTINGLDSTPQAVAPCVFPPRNAVYLFWKANDASNRIYYSPL